VPPERKKQPEYTREQNGTNRKTILTDSSKSADTLEKRKMDTNELKSDMVKEN
jgi:hypothetical protein